MVLSWCLLGIVSMIEDGYPKEIHVEMFSLSDVLIYLCEEVIKKGCQCI
jgi:hypothetical protein